MKNIKYINSQFSVIPSSLSILEETSIGLGINKIRMKVILQERDVVNNNRRTYDGAILQLIVNELGPKATARKLIAELDHPIQRVDDINERMKRTATLSLDRACLLFTKLEYDGRYIHAECETLTTQKGQILYALIKDKVMFGFSLRALGETVQNPDGTIRVLIKNFKPITFDVVSMPSHSNAVVTEFLNESEISSAISAMRNIKNSVNEVDFNNTKVASMILENSTPELLESTYFVGDNVKLISNDLSPEARSVILESTEEFQQNNYNKYCFGNTCILGTLEESMTYLMGIQNTKIIGFKL